MPLFTRFLKSWVPLAFLATTLCFLVYGTVQQSYRQSANDPQIQLAEDAAAVGKTSMPTGTTAGNVSINESLAPYIVFYNDSGEPTSGNGLLDGQPPALPQGIFDYVRTHGETRVTWQPRAGIRQAIVVVRESGAGHMPGFIMAGRSLREVEVREGNLGLITFAAWVFIMIGSVVLVALAVI